MLVSQFSFCSSVSFSALHNGAMTSTSDDVLMRWRWGNSVLVTNFVLPLACHLLLSHDQIEKMFNLFVDCCGQSRHQICLCCQQKWNWLTLDHHTTMAEIGQMNIVWSCDSPPSLHRCSLSQHWCAPIAAVKLHKMRHDFHFLCIVLQFWPFWHAASLALFVFQGVWFRSKWTVSEAMILKSMISLCFCHHLLHHAFWMQFPWKQIAFNFTSGQWNFFNARWCQVHWLSDNWKDSQLFSKAWRVQSFSSLATHLQFPNANEAVLRSSQLDCYHWIHHPVIPFPSMRVCASHDPVGLSSGPSTAVRKILVLAPGAWQRCSCFSAASLVHTRLPLFVNCCPQLVKWGLSKFYWRKVTENGVVVSMCACMSHKGRCPWDSVELRKGASETVLT